MTDMYNLSMAIKSSTLELKRLRTGPLLDSINSHFHERMSNASSKTKLYIYSAHDTTIVNLLNSLDIFDLQIPRYSSIVMMELHKTLDTNNYFISFSFRNDTQREPYKLKLPICELDCPYEEFTKFVEPMIPQDWDAECQLEPAPSNTEVNPIGMCLDPFLIRLTTYYPLVINILHVFVYHSSLFHCGRRGSATFRICIFSIIQSSLQEEKSRPRRIRKVLTTAKKSRKVRVD